MELVDTKASLNNMSSDHEFKSLWDIVWNIPYDFPIEVIRIILFVNG